MTKKPLNFAVACALAFALIGGNAALAQTTYAVGNQDATNYTNNVVSPSLWDVSGAASGLGGSLSYVNNQANTAYSSITNTNNVLAGYSASITNSQNVANNSYNYANVAYSVANSAQGSANSASSLGSAAISNASSAVNTSNAALAMGNAVVTRAPAASNVQPVTTFGGFSQCGGSIGGFSWAAVVNGVTVNQGEIFDTRQGENCGEG